MTTKAVGSKAPRRISPIPYPATTEPYQADRAIHLGNAGAEHARTMVESGFISLPKIPPELMPQHVVCVVVDKLNNIIDAFNVIISDLDGLPALALVMDGSPSVRLEVLVRAFWSEAYRGKAIVFKSMGELRRQGYVDKTFVATLREAFEQTLDPMYGLRHSLQHADAELGGTALYRLRAVEALLAETHVDLEGMGPTLLTRSSTEAYREKGDAVYRLATMFRDVFGIVVVAVAQAVGLPEPTPGHDASSTLM